MTSRERIISAINHKEPDMLPIDFGAMRSTGISIVAYDQLLKHLKINKRPKLYDVFQQLAEPDAEVLERLGGDVVQAHRMYPAFNMDIRKWKEKTIFDNIRALVPEGYNPVVNKDGTSSIIQGGFEIARMPAGGFYFDSVVFPLQDAETVEDVENLYSYEPMSEEEISFIEEEVKSLYYGTDKAILFAFGGNILEAGESAFGFEKFMENLLIEPDMVHAYFKRLCEGYLSDLERLMPRIAPYINIIQFGDDLGSQESLLIGTGTYREHIKPYHKRLYGYINKNYPEVKVFLHSCGAIFDLIPDLIEAGVQILNPVQITAKGMDPRLLKERFGDRLVFWGGGARMQTTVMSGTLADIRRETEELIRIFNDGGGYVFNQVHNIQAGVSPEKILCIYDTALSFRPKK